MFVREKAMENENTIILVTIILFLFVLIGHIKARKAFRDDNIDDGDNYIKYRQKKLREALSSQERVDEAWYTKYF